MTTQCYGIDGTPYSTFGRYIPCNATAAANGLNTACCAPGDICLSNGFCQSQLDSSRNSNLFWRNGCTDRTWNDPACPKYCDGLDSPDTHGIYYCPNNAQNSYCCPTGLINTGPAINTTCCNISSLVFTAASPFVYTTAQLNKFVSNIPATSTADSQSNTLATSRATSPGGQPSSTSANTHGSSSTTSSSSGVNTTAIGVGVPLGILLAIALGVIAWLFLQNKKLRKGQATHEFPANYAAQQEKLPEFPGQSVVYQQSPMYAPQQRPNEMPDQEVASELAGRNWR